jgi:hypothetical protein
VAFKVKNVRRPRSATGSKFNARSQSPPRGEFLPPFSPLKVPHQDEKEDGGDEQAKLTPGASFYYGGKDRRGLNKRQEGAALIKERQQLFPTSFINVADLSKWLKKYQVRVEQFGIGTSKNLGHLLSEIEAGESQLCISKIPMSLCIKQATSQEYEIVRELHVVNILIFNSNKSKVLVESHRSFTKHQQCVEKGKLPAIKMRTSFLPPNMTLREGVAWCASSLLQKELCLKGTKSTFQHSKMLPPNTSIRYSNSMPGLKGRYHIHQLEVDVRPGSVVVLHPSLSQPAHHPVYEQTMDGMSKKSHGQRRCSFVANREAIRRGGAMSGWEVEFFKNFTRDEPFVTREPIPDTTACRGEEVLHHWAWVPVEEVLEQKTIDAFGAKPVDSGYAGEAPPLPELVTVDEDDEDDKLQGRLYSGVGPPPSGALGDIDEEYVRVQMERAQSTPVNSHTSPINGHTFGLSRTQARAMQRNRKGTVDIAKSMLARTVLGDLKAASSDDMRGLVSDFKTAGQSGDHHLSVAAENRYVSQWGWRRELGCCS